MSREIEKMTARFVVHRATEWDGFATAHYFLKPLSAEWDGDEDEAVAQLLYEVASDAIPSDFEFQHKDLDKMGHSMFGEEGIVIEVHEEAKRLKTGDIVDIDISVVGRVEFR